MSTTDHAHSRASAGHSATSGVIHLDALKRRKRLDRLEATRSHLATMAAQQRSHGLDEAQDSFSLQISIENTIRDELGERTLRSGR